MSGDCGIGRTTGAERVSEAIRRACSRDGLAVVAYLTAGYPTKAGFAGVLRDVASSADVLEIGVPFSDPMADGVTIQESSRVALEQGVTLEWILAELAELSDLDTPLVLMSYLNPLMRFGFDSIVSEAERAGVCGVIVPDLPVDEASQIAAPLHEAGMAVVQMATPVSNPERVRRIAAESTGFLYAVTTTGTTGQVAVDIDTLATYLAGLRSVSPVPVCAGFGIRSSGQARQLRGHCDGVIVGSALIELLSRGESPSGFLREMREAGRG